MEMQVKFGDLCWRSYNHIFSLHAQFHLLAQSVLAHRFPFPVIMPVSLLELVFQFQQ